VDRVGNCLFVRKNYRIVFGHTLYFIGEEVNLKIINLGITGFLAQKILNIVTKSIF